jgi:hypothetical protein
MADRRHSWAPPGHDLPRGGVHAPEDDAPACEIGFSQCYTYFTWRNTKRELTEYLTELAASADYFRPHFFVNTPDINPYFLQRSGRAGFLIRAALAATLSSLWGIYSGFELCEAAPLPGREEYLGAEKYEIKHRNHRAPGNIVAEIATLNRIRRTNPALQTLRELKFYNAFNDHVMVYGKMQPSHHEMITLPSVSIRTGRRKRRSSFPCGNGRYPTMAPWRSKISFTINVLCSLASYRGCGSIRRICPMRFGASPRYRSDSHERIRQRNAGQAAVRARAVD